MAPVCVEVDLVVVEWIEVDVDDFEVVVLLLVVELTVVGTEVVLVTVFVETEVAVVVV